MDSAICGGNRKYAEKLIRQKGHCEKHKRFKKGCEECFNKWLYWVDATFMATMR